jgi:protein-disulfide isomerase
LLVVFAVGLLQAAARGIKLQCGCFGGGGISETTNYTLDVLRDAGLIVLAVYLIVWPLTRFSVDEYLARNDYVPPPSAKRMRTAQGQRKYNAMVETRRKAARERTLYLSAALSVLIVLISIIGIGVQANRAKIQGDLTATNATVANGVVVGKPAKVTVDFFEDFQCPICNKFEQSAGSDVAAQIAAGRIQARYHTMAFLDEASNGNRYSSRAANAALCASDVSVAAFQKYHAILFGKDSKGQNNQPAEGTHGRTDAQLLQYAKQAGITGDNLTTFQSCTTGQLHKAMVVAITDNASKRGVTGTPTVFVNGKQLKTVDKAHLDAAIAAIAGPTPTTPSRTPTSSSSASTSVAP